MRPVVRDVFIHLGYVRHRSVGKLLELTLLELLLLDFYFFIEAVVGLTAQLLGVVKMIELLLGAVATTHTQFVQLLL